VNIIARIQITYYIIRGARILKEKRKVNDFTDNNKNKDYRWIIITALIIEKIMYDERNDHK
jgi:hypothetical protein